MKNQLLFFLCCFLTVTIQAQNPSARLDTLIAHYENHNPYDWASHPLGNYSESVYTENAAFAKAILDSLGQIPKEGLKETRLISYELLQFVLENEVNEFKFKTYLNPLQADQGFHLDLNYRIRTIADMEQAEKYLKTLQAIPKFTKDNFALTRKGMAQGIIQPTIIFKGYENSYNSHIVDDPKKSPFYEPFNALPDYFSRQRKDSLQQAAAEIIRDSVVPSFKDIKTFFETEYLPKTRVKIGVSAQPNGAEFYQDRIDYYTTSTGYTAQSIHDLGLQEVARIRTAMEKNIEQTGFKGSFAEFLEFLRTDDQFYVKSGDELLIHARDIAKRIDAQLSRYFATLPRQPYGVIPVPDALAPKYTGGRYSGNSIDSKEPGYYLVNTYKLDSRPLYTLPPLTAHEAVPGHHLQGALNQEMGDSIPQFRRNLYLSAYGEGWGLYSEYLADEMGIYTTHYEKFGQLTYEMWRACRLVVDTGIHALDWSRDEVVDYMSKNTALSIHEINTETDRYIGWPGQALSYKIGELKIRELRKKAETTLGDKFDIRKFHEVILGQGTVTLPILERRVLSFIERSGVNGG